MQIFVPESHNCFCHQASDENNEMKFFSSSIKRSFFVKRLDCMENDELEGELSQCHLTDSAIPWKLLYFEMWWTP
uniref:Uncharacterized protein n=1 Tax=Rhizophora mucronata TaxID=61149 RepID=A0A2P2P1N5_RHIMU